MEPETTLSIRTIPLSHIESVDNFLQTGFWGKFKAKFGWNPLSFTWHTNTASGSLLVLERSLPCGLHLAYVPYGPVLPDTFGSRETSSLLIDLAKGLAEYLNPTCFMMRFDLTGGTRGPIGTNPGQPNGLLRPLRKAPYRVQPSDTVILPLNGNEEEVLAKMHKKTRYNIRLAGRKGVSIRRLDGKAALEALPKWYSLYRETGVRDGITLHSESYYRQLLAEAGDAVLDGIGLSLYVASHEGEMLAGIIVSRYGKRVTYMYGASASRKRELMPNHLLQWQAIRDAIAEGAHEYDFYGIPPSEDVNHPMHGLWRFKTGFGGYIHHYLGAWDYPYRPVIYHLYATLEKLRGIGAARRKRQPV